MSIFVYSMNSKRYVFISENEDGSVTEFDFRKAKFIEKDFHSRGSHTYSKPLRENEEEGDTQLTALSGRIEPFSLDDNGNNNPLQDSEPVKTPIWKRQRVFPVSNI